MLHEKTRMGEVTLVVTNIKRSLEFYKSIIGFSNIEETANGAKLFNANGELLLILEENTQAAVAVANKYSGLYHFALLYPDRKSLATQLKHLAEMNIRIGGADHLVSEAIYLSDPDGNGIELYRDRPRSEWMFTDDNDVVMDTKPLEAESLLELAGEWKGLPAKVMMGHVHMHVGNLEKTAQFYKDLFGFEIMARYGTQALFMAAGRYHHHLGFNTWAGSGAIPQPKPAAGMKSFKVHIPDEASYRVVLDRMKANRSVIEEGDAYFKLKEPSSMIVVVELLR